MNEFSRKMSSSTHDTAHSSNARPKKGKKKKSGRARAPTEQDQYQIQEQYQQQQQIPPEMVYFQQEQMPYQYHQYQHQHQQSRPQYGYSSMNPIYSGAPVESNAAYQLTIMQTDVDYNIRNAQATELITSSLLSSAELSEKIYLYCLRVDGILQNHYRRNMKQTDDNNTRGGGPSQFQARR